LAPEPNRFENPDSPLSREAGEVAWVVYSELEINLAIAQTSLGNAAPAIHLQPTVNLERFHFTCRHRDPLRVAISWGNRHLAISVLLALEVKTLKSIVSTGPPLEKMRRITGLYHITRLFPFISEHLLIDD
jgi:hypothetical protein